MIELGALEPGRETLRAAADRGDAIARRQLHQLVATGHFQFGWREWNASWMEKVAEPRPEEAQVLLRRWAAAGDEWAKKTLEGPPPGTGGLLSFDDE